MCDLVLMRLYKSTRVLIFSALLIALDVVFTRFLRWEFVWARLEKPRLFDSLFTRAET